MAVPGRGEGRPHVGRERELARIRTAVVGPAGGGAVVAGPAGVGKSHVLDMVAAELAAEGWSLVRAHGDPTRAEPFGAFGDVLPPLSGDPDRWALVLRAGLDHLVATGGGDRLVLVADDLHAFDPASAALVQQAVLDGRIRLAGTLRPGDAPDAVTGLWKDDLVERIDLAPLARHESARLAELLVGGPVDADSHARLWTWTDGNPLLLTEIVEQARLQGGWRQVAGLWHIDGAPTRSPRLAGLVEQRIAGSSPGVADLVDAIALAGRLPMPVADALVGRAAVATAERARLVRLRDEHDRVGVVLDHPLYGELRRAATPRHRQVALRNRLLDVVESLDPTPQDGNGGVTVGPADMALVAEWYLETGRTAAHTPDILLAAAERAWAGDAPERAAALARRAWELRPDDRAGHLLVCALARIGGTEELARLAPQVAASARSDRVRAQAVRSHALALFQFANQPELALGVLEDGARHVADPLLHGTLTTEAASYRLQMGDVRGAEALAAPLFASANPRVVVEAAAVVAPARALLGRIEESMAAARRGLELAEAMPDELVDRSQYLFHMLTALIDDGKVGAAERLATAALDDSSAERDRFANGLVAVSLGRIYRLRGRPATATRWCQEAVASMEAVSRVGFAAWALALLAAVRADLGDVDGAREAAARCRALRDHPIRVGAAEVRRSLAWVHVAEGDLDAAARELEDAAEHGLAAGELVHAAHALHDLVRLGLSGAARDRLVRLGDETDSAILRVYADHAAASFARDRQALRRVAEDFEALGCVLLAAEVWSEVGGLDAASGDRRSAVAANRQAGLLAERCEGARSPLLAARVATVDDLSAREREIAVLAAAGVVRRQIAERLVISPRTVDSHLQRIYRKLGVTSRDDLAAVLADHDPD